jgi:hypothetical protein
MLYHFFSDKSSLHFLQRKGKEGEKETLGYRTCWSEKFKTQNPSKESEGERE